MFEAKFIFLKNKMMATHSIVSLRSLGCHHFNFCFVGRIVRLLIQKKTRKIERRAKDLAVTKIESHAFRKTKARICGSFFLSVLFSGFQVVNSFFIENIII